MKTLISLGLLLGSFLLMTAPTGQIKGIVADKNNNIINGATVVLYQNDVAVWQSTVSGNGLFSAMLTAGTYAIKVTAEGYLPYVKRNIRITTDQTVYLKVTLKEVEKTEIMEMAEQEVYMNIKVSPAAEHMVTGRARLMDYGAVPTSFTYVSDDYYGIEHNTESYDVVNENIFKDAVNNPLSTFSIDVDRASYANVRRFLNQNQRPPIDAVRIEELINYFDYDYPQPQNGHPFSVNIEMDKCPWNENNRLVLIGLKGEDINEKDIPPNNLVFLIDVSGSMYPANRLPLLKQAFKYLTDNLRAQDKVSIVVYAGAAGLVLEPTMGTEKAKIKAAIDNLQAGGSTAGGQGIQLAYKIAKENYLPKGNNRVILATDGDFNVGVSSNAELVRLIERERESGVYLTILGFGMGNYKDSRMETLSNAGNGNYAYIDNILEAKKVFGTELWGTLYTIANDVKIQVEFNPAHVKAYRLIGYENRLLNKEDFNNDKKDAGDIGCGHAVTALYEIIPAKAEGFTSSVDELEYQKSKLIGSKNMMTVKIRYKHPKDAHSNLIVERFQAERYSGSNNIRFAAAVAQFGMLLRDSEFKGTASYEKVIQQAKASLGVDEFGYRNDFVKLVEIAEMITSK